LRIICERNSQSFTEFPVAPVVFHRTASVFLNQLSRHQPTEEGTVRGEDYRNEIGYAGPKTFQNNVSQDAIIKTIDTCLVQTF
jgi:hypothetical protein